MMQCRGYSHSFILLLLLLGALLLWGCRGDSASVPASSEDAGTEANPPYPELNDFLMSELERLGKDPSKTTSEVAKGDSDRVFDLKPALIDPDGPGGDPATGVSLDWTEVLIGDYDQNGLVTIAEITALGQNLGKSVSYDAPALHGGFAFWPAGDPDDDGGESPPAAGSPAANWRLARIDGNRDGLLTINDITPIAQNWQEALSGYRIYRQAPGESSFTMLQGLPGTNDFLSVTHPSAPGNSPVLYSFADDSATTSGVYLYYVAPYDLQSQAQGPASGIVSIDLDTGTVNSSPVANLSVTPDFAGAPAEITLDAAGSYDPDGSIAAYEWDFDGDGTTDWLSTDPLPEMSSDGTVDSFEVVSAGKIKATYRQGSDDYFQPSVRAIDDLSAQSNPADAQLGISGWDYDILNASVADYKLPIVVEAMSVDPITDEIVAAGYTYGASETAGVLEGGVYFARRAANGEWTYEKVPISDIGINNSKGTVKGIVRQICWDSDSNPTILLLRRVEGGLGVTDPDRLWRSTRMKNGTWNSIKMIVQDDSGNASSSKMLSELDTKQLPDGSVVSILIETLEDKGSLVGGSIHFRFHIMHNLNGTWQTEFSGFDTADTLFEPRRLLVQPDATVYALFNGAEGLPSGIPAALWTPGEGFGEPFSLDGGQVNLGSEYRVGLASSDLNGNVFCYYEVSINPRIRALVSIVNNTSFYDELSDEPEFNNPPVSNFIVNSLLGTQILIDHIDSLNRYMECRIYTGKEYYSELLLPPLTNNALTNQGSIAMTVDVNGRSYVLAVITDHPDFPETEFARLYVLFRHLDPRLK